MPDLLTQERVQEYLALALNYDPCYIEPVCRTLLAYMEAVEKAQHGAGCGYLDYCDYVKSGRIMSDYTGSPSCNCWKSRIGK